MIPTLLGYEFDPYVAVDFMQHMWDTEPVGTLGILISSTGVVLTLVYKLCDILWDIRKENSRQGKLRIELYSEVLNGNPGIKAVLSNTGKEPIVVRDLGYFSKGVLKGRFTRLNSDSDNPLPRVVNSRELVMFHFDQQHPQLNAIQTGFAVRDSMGKVWEAPKGELKAAHKQLRRLVKDLQTSP